MTREEIDELLDKKLREAALGTLGKAAVEEIADSRYDVLAAEREAQDALRIREGTETELKKWAAIFGIVNLGAIIAGALAIAFYVAKVLPTETTIHGQVITYIKNSLNQEPREYVERIHREALDNQRSKITTLEERMRQIDDNIKSSSTLLASLQSEAEKFKMIDRYAEANAKLTEAAKNVDGIYKQIAAIKSEFFDQAANGRILEGTYREVAGRLAAELKSSDDLWDRLYAALTASIPLFLVPKDTPCPLLTREQGEIDTRLRLSVFRSLRGALEAICDNSAPHPPAACAKLEPVIADLQKVQAPALPQAIFKVCQRS